MAEPTQEQKPEQKMENSIIDAIKSENARMHSRWYFAARTALFTLTVFILSAALLYLVSFIIFALQQNGDLLALGFGWSGWIIFLGGIPWGLLLLSLALIVVLAGLLARYEFVYRHPLFYAIFFFVIIIIIASFWIAATSFHKIVYEYSSQDFPLIGELYQFETEGPASIHRGTIVAVAQNGFIIADIGRDGATSSVVASPGVIFSGDFHVGDNVVIFGDREPDGSIAAFGVEKASP